MTNAFRVEAMVTVGPSARGRYLGRHAFVSLPRVGEEIHVVDSDEQLALKVDFVAYIADALESTSSRLQPLPAASVHLFCTEI